MTAIDEKSKLFSDRLDAYTQNVKVLNATMDAQFKEVTGEGATLGHRRGFSRTLARGVAATPARRA